MPEWRRLSEQEIESIARSRKPSSPCLRPGCPSMCTYRTERAGRQKIFCSDVCRVTYTRTRLRLIDTWLTLQWNAGYTDPTIPAADLAALQKHVAWELQRYGGLDDTVYVQLPDPPAPDGRTETEHQEQLAQFFAGRRPETSPAVLAAKIRHRLTNRTPPRE